MGYVCERHTSILPGLTNANSRTENTCEQNVWGIKPFRRIPGCAQPAYCQAETEVIDAWTRADQNSGKILFGFAVQIKLTAEFIAANTNTGYSILIRFPDTVKSYVGLYYIETLTKNCFSTNSSYNFTVSSSNTLFLFRKNACW